MRADKPAKARTLPEGDHATALIHPREVNSAYESPNSTGAPKGPPSGALSTSEENTLNTLHLKSAEPQARIWLLRGWNATHRTVDLKFFFPFLEEIVLLTHLRWTFINSQFITQLFIVHQELTNHCWHHRYKPARTWTQKPRQI